MNPARIPQAPYSSPVMERHTFIGVITGSLLAGPFAAEAQPAPKVARLGVLLFSTPPAEPNLPALLTGPRDLGYAEGRNIVLQYRGAEGRPERVSGLAHEIVALKPDLILVLGGDLVPFVSFIGDAGKATAVPQRGSAVTVTHPCRSVLEP
jgi:hypothetical protein